MLPDWMKMKQQDSLGWNFMNALLSQRVDESMLLIQEVDDSQGMDSPDLNEIDTVYSNRFATYEGSMHKDIVIEGILDNTRTHIIPSNTLGIGATGVLPIVVDKVEYFAKGAPTRLSYYSSDDRTITGLTGDITGISYVKHWRVLDDDGLETIEKQDVTIINQATTTPCGAGQLSTIVLDSEDNIIASYDYGLGYQDYGHTGKYEVVTDPSGHIMEFNPIISTVKVYDYINVDPSGNAQLMPSENYTITQEQVDYNLYTTLTMAGTNLYNSVSIDNSNYFVEYQYAKYTYPKQMTTGKSKWGIQEMASPPLFASYPVNYYGTKIPIEIGDTVYSNGALLRTDTDVLRPGSTATVKFNYIQASDVVWDGITAFSHDLSDDGNFVSIDSAAVHVLYDTMDITPYYDPSVVSALVSIPYVEDPTKSMTPPYTVRCYYTASKTYSSVSGVQSFSDIVGIADPYPSDYKLDGDYLTPYTMLPVTDADENIKLALLGAGVDDFEVTSNILFSGMAYDKDKNCYWVLEGNNLVLYKIRPGDGALLGKWNIFKRPNIYYPGYKTMASGVIDVDQNITRDYYFLSNSKDDSSRTAAGIVYYKDFLYILSTSDGLNVDGITVGGSGIWRLDTYNDRVMDIEYEQSKLEKYPHFPLGTLIGGSGICGGSIPIDITMDDYGDFLVSGGDTVSKLKLHYDYVILDNVAQDVEGTIYYRENYTTVDVQGFDEVY